MDILPIHPEALQPVWPKVREGLLQILEKSPEDWIPEDVYHALKAGHAQLFLIVNADGVAAFFVLRTITREYSKQQDMHVWCAHSEGGVDVFDAGVEFMRQAARRAGCKRLTFGSSRKGWEKRFRVSDITYEIDL